MPLIDEKYVINVKWNEECTLPELFVNNECTPGGLLADVINNQFLESYTETPWYILEGRYSYLWQYRTSAKNLAVLNFYIYPEYHLDIGVVESSVPTDDCMLFKTDHKGAFEVYVFKKMEHKEDELFSMLIDGDLNKDIASLKS